MFTFKLYIVRDVNNYVAITDYGHKGKGIFNIHQITKNPAAAICVIAATEKLINNKSIEDTIYECTDINQFLTVRSVTGGAVWKGQYLGRVVRWIYSTDGEKITYKKNGNKVPKSDGSRPVMELDGMVDDLDYERYCTEAEGILEDIGYL